MLRGHARPAIGLAEDLRKGVIERSGRCPMARSAVLAGRTMADLCRNVFVVLLMTVVGVAVGFRSGTGFFSFMAGVVLVLLFAYALSWGFAVVGLDARNAETAQAMAFPLLFPLTFASSAFAPVSTMPGWMQAFARNQPVSVVIDAAAHLMVGGPIPGCPAGAGLDGRHAGRAHPAGRPEVPQGGLKPELQRVSETAGRDGRDPPLREDASRWSAGGRRRWLQWRRPWRSRPGRGSRVRDLGLVFDLVATASRCFRPWPPWLSASSPRSGTVQLAAGVVFLPPGRRGGRRRAVAAEHRPSARAGPPDRLGQRQFEQPQPRPGGGRRPGPEGGPGPAHRGGRRGSSPRRPSTRR